VHLHVLGSAAGGGVPQWNCGCSNCTAAREKRLPQRTQASLAASTDGQTWVLFNATTDLRRQIESDASLAPRGMRGSPICAVILTDANVDHAAGLLDLRQAGPLSVYSTEAVRSTLVDCNAMFAPFARPPRTWGTVDERGIEVAGLRIARIAVDGLLPAYAGGQRVDGAVSAFTIEDRSGARALYAPVFLEVNSALASAANDAGVALFDGSFWSDGELAEHGLGSRTAREMGHAPIDGPGGSLAKLRGAACARKYYTHINNSNPVLDPSSAEAATLGAAGMFLAEDGARIIIENSGLRVSAGA
jgi:pyrroloquinoline quinone biosynthesis protein B